jgi:hypothetical protein
MNKAHALGKLRNRLKRCQKRLADKELGGEQRTRLVQRQSELTQLLK